MRLPALSTALRLARETLVRFPLAMAAGLVAAVTGMLMVEGPSEDAHPRLLATAIVGLALFTATVTSAERRGIAPRHRAVADLLLVLGLAWLYSASLDWSDRLAMLRFAQLLVVAHLTVAVAPYLSADRLDGFWQFNRVLFLRYLIGAFYALVLWLGLAVALGALDKLFGVDVRGEAYAHLWVLLAFVFHPWFFLTGVPQDFEGLERRDDYPTGLKVFAQFILMPLVAVYLVILTAYLAKVLITRSWPTGWIGYLVSSVSATGVLALLLVHPLREREDSRWVNAYGRWLFVVLLPPLGMLLAAVLQRIGQYGITEPRYFLLVLALWLTGLSVYYAVTASRNIKLIPISLGAVALLTAAGPWSAYAVSRRSQSARFDGLLQAHQMGRVGAAHRSGAVVPARDLREMSAILRYLNEVHGEAEVGRALGVPADSLTRWRDSLNFYGEEVVARKAMQSLGLRYSDRWGAAPGILQPFWINTDLSPTVSSVGYEAVRSVSFPGSYWIGTAGDSLQVVHQVPTGAIEVRHADTLLFTLDVRAALEAAVSVDSLLNGRGVVLKRQVIVEGEGGGYRIRLAFQQMNGEIRNDRPAWQSGMGLLLAGGFPRPR